MADIKSFPTEILDVIFQQAIPQFYDIDPFPWMFSEPQSLPYPSRALFPFNVASVCSHWCDIMKASPRYWKSIAIDVADNPTPFLDTFSLFNRSHRLINVFIFSSNKNRPTDALQKALENSRARSVFKHLEPVLARCESITYDLVYQSSLPSPAIILTSKIYSLAQLSLSCIIHDFDNDLKNIEEMKYRCCSYNKLQKLSLTGFGFMELVRMGGKWLRDFVSEVEDGYLLHALSIDHFIFREHNLGNPNVERTLGAFISSLSSVQETVVDISLSDLSLDYHPSTPPGPSPYTEPLGMQRLSFDNVSSDFLSAFFSAIQVPKLTSVSFEQCSIPPIGIDIRHMHSDLDLNLVYIPFPPFQSLHHEQMRNESFDNAIKAFLPDHLQLLYCEGVTDALFHWLSKMTIRQVEAPTLKSLRIHDCTGFTSSAVCSFIRARALGFHASGSSSNGVSQLKRVVVYGEVPLLSTCDAAWLRETCGRKDMTYVSWNVDGDAEEVQDHFITDLRPIAEEDIWNGFKHYGT